MFGSSASAEVLFHADFENNTRAPFERYHAVQANPPRIDLVPTPAGNGRNRMGEMSARIEVRPGDDARLLDVHTGRQIGNNVYRERSELALVSPIPGQTFIREGDDIWLGWQAMFPSNLWSGVDRTGDGSIFLQFHHVDVANDAYNGSPPLMFIADDENLEVVQCTRYLCPSDSKVTRLREKLKYDHWYTFVVHMIHSRDPNKGLLEVWIDGEKRFSVKTNLLFGSNFANYLLTGNYRRPNSPRTSVMYADNYVMATTEAEVLSLLGPASVPKPETEPGLEPGPESQPGSEPLPHEGGDGTSAPVTSGPSSPKLPPGPVSAMAQGCRHTGTQAAIPLLAGLALAMCLRPRTRRTG